MAYRRYLFASVAASALNPSGAYAAAEIGFSGSPGTPAFSCGEGSLGIQWGVAAASQPELSYVSSDGVAGETFSFRCDHKRNFVQTIARKSGEGQKDFLKISFKEAFASKYQPDGDTDHKLTIGRLGGGLFSYKFDVVQGGFIDDKYTPLHLGYKFVFAQPEFLGAASFKYDFDNRIMSALIPLQETEGDLALFAPGAVPEPQTWASMILGLLVTGSALRAQRKRRKRVSAW